jgi:3-phosphoshikimate 1-carboxyvinyltransferase
VRALGAHAAREAPGRWRVHGVGVGGFTAPDDVLDFGNSGTGARLLMGAVAGQPVTAVFSGDASLRRRPMGRITAPLAQIGARFEGRAGDLLPITVIGARAPMPIRYPLPVASAQVKSAVLLAGLNAPGRTVVIEPEPTRDHTERLLRHFGAQVTVDDGPEGRIVAVDGQPELVPAPIVVPGDPSSAAFPLVAALIVPGSAVTVEGVCVNPLRAGLFETLGEMGADITVANLREEGGEPVADITARAGPLRGIAPPPARAPAMIDEYPILAVAAACAEGRTVLRGLRELRVKESDRIGAMARGLAACGVAVEELEDGLIIDGLGEAARVPGGATVETHMDHRIAMAFLVLGLGARAPVAVDDHRMIDTSFPGFPDLMRGLGAALELTCAVRP